MPSALSRKRVPHQGERASGILCLSGFTLVELLVVIAIIGILIALLMPAVQAARESARRAQCSNNIKQLAHGCHLHHEQVRYFPTGGWGASWIGDPDRGFGEKQPGGWVYCILPFVEQQALHDLGRGQSGATKQQSADKMVGTPVGTFICPSRRRVKAYPINSSTNCCAFYYSNSGQQLNPQLKGKSDYAANYGDTLPLYSFSPAQPTSYTQGDATGFAWYDTSKVTGISFVRSELDIAQIRDGTSHTYLLGEKMVNPDNYEDSGDGGDDWTMYTGWQDDIYRSAYCADSSTNPPTGCLTPDQDRAGVTNYNNFGSSHSGASNFAFCDGSVRSIAYSIDMELHRRLCNRKDGQVIDTSDL